MQERQAQVAAAQDQEAAGKRARAMAAAEENRILAENKRRNEMAARIRVDLKEEVDVTRARHKIQSGIIR